MTAVYPRVYSYDMPATILPPGTIRSNEQPFSHKTLIRLLKDLSGSPFTGYLSVTTGDRLFLLFIFQGHPYSAGLIVTEKSSSLTITNFCAQVAAIHESSSISLHETDPVLLKCLLIFIQDEPTAKGPVNLINLESMVQQIQANTADALVILERNKMCNFFFFLDGTKTAAYWSDNPQKNHDGLSVDKQMLVYAHQDSGSPVHAIIYQSIKTMESLDSANMSLDSLIRLFSTIENVAQDSETGELTMQHHEHLTLKVVEGNQAGTELDGLLPCILGRKDADIIINDPMVSKRHAAIQIINGKLMLIDLHSTNGTTLNNEPITQRELKQGDRIGIGQTILVMDSINLS